MKELITPIENVIKFLFITKCNKVKVVKDFRYLNTYFMILVN